MSSRASSLYRVRRWSAATAVIAFAAGCTGASSSPSASAPSAAGNVPAKTTVAAAGRGVSLTEAPAPAALIGLAAAPQPAAAAKPAPPAPIAAPAPTPKPVVAQAPATEAPKPAAAPGLPPVMPFEEAVSFAANNLLSKAELPGGASSKHLLVIDPLIDGNSGLQSVATETMGARIGAVVKSGFANNYDLQPFNTVTVARGPLLLIGTFTAVDKDMKNAGQREIYRICLALADLRTGKLVSKGFARSSMDGVDTTPLAAFRDSPAWSPDMATDGYVRTCQGTKVGDAINPAYYDRIVAAAMISDATGAYNAGRYEEALDIYRALLRIGAGDQLRVHNGIYLSAWRLGRKDEATQAFARIVDYGLRQKRLGVKFLFRPGSTQFFTDPYVSVAYPIWLSQIAQRAAEQNACIEVSGHTSRTGSEPVNDRLSHLRAQFIKLQLERQAPALSNKLSTVGRGWNENIVGLGTDDARDALDRRVEFKITNC
jgi:outer membrane protein OmpA-like peptidoglycan-associated protein